MSTKIYDAYIFPSRSMGTLLKECREIAQLAREARNKYIVETYSGDLMALQDRAWKVEQTKQRDPLADYSFEASFFPDGETIVVKLYSEHDFLKKCFFKVIKARDFHYQNSTDKPRNVSAKAWEQRSVTWDRLLPGSGIPSENSFTFTFLTYNLNTWDISTLRKNKKVKK